MQQSGVSPEPSGSRPLAADVPRLVRAISNWAAERPVVAEATLFGSRLDPDHPRFAPVEVAVRYDDRGMTDGFDDWIEQLRTNFADLRASLAEPVSVLTPDHGPSWEAVVRGTTVAHLSTGKVRVLQSAAVAGAGATPRAVLGKSFQSPHRIRRSWHFIASLAASGKPF